MIAVMAPDSERLDKRHKTNKYYSSVSYTKLRNTEIKKMEYYVNYDAVTPRNQTVFLIVGYTKLNWHKM